jgi:hypothetical protein
VNGGRRPNMHRSDALNGMPVRAGTCHSRQQQRPGG